MVLTRVVLMAVVVGLVHMRDGSRRAFCYRPSLGLRSARWGMEVGLRTKRDAPPTRRAAPTATARSKKRVRPVPRAHSTSVSAKAKTAWAQRSEGTQTPPESRRQRLPKRE